MDTTAPYGELHRLFDKNFLDYTSYVIKERAIPDIADGLKPVQRRIVQTLFNMDDGRFHKVANVVGASMKLHPHGDQSIFGALVNLANKNFLLDRQGNFGNIYTGDHAAASRYIECRLSPLAKETLFNKDLTEFVDSYDGRMREPVTLPAKLPFLLIQGAEGIAVGMATKIMPHNFCELINAQIRILKNKPFEVYPDFSQGGFLDVTHYNKGNGRIKCRAKIVEKNEKTILIKEIPYTTTTQSLIESIEKAARLGKIKIQSIDDYTAEEVEIEINLARGVYAADTIRALYAFSDCEVSISPNLTVIHDGRPANLSVDDVLCYNTEKLVRDLEKELEIELDRLKERLHAHLLEQIFIEERLYKEIEECKSLKAVIETIETALVPYRDRLERDVRREDIERLLEIRIKRISRYDINRKHKEIKEVNSSIRKTVKHLKDMTGFTIRYLDDLLLRYGDFYPRRTRIKTFREVDARKVAILNLTVGYDRKSGFLGHHIKAGPDNASFACSEYDRMLLIFSDGMYKVINVIDKLFVGHDLAWVGKVEENIIFNIIYRDGRMNMSYIKRFCSPKFILDKEYRLFTEHKKSQIQLLEIGEGVLARVYFVPSRKAKSNIFDCIFDEFLIKGPGAIGKRISTRRVRRVVTVVDKEAAKEKIDTQPLLPGIGRTRNDE